MDWYEDRRRGTEHQDSRPLIEELELKRVMIPARIGKKTPTTLTR